MARLSASLALVCMGSAVALADPVSGLVGHWRFDGSGGATAPDLTGGPNHATVVDGRLRPEKAGASLELDGVSGHVRIDWTPPASLTREITAALWVNAARLRNNTVLFGIPNTRADWVTPVFGMYATGGRVVYGQFGDDAHPKVLVESPTPLPLDTWVFLAATSDGTTVRLYRDGRLDAEVAKPAVLAFNGNPLLIGMGLGNKPSLRGRVGELRLYSRALAAAEVAALYDLTRDGYGQSQPSPPAARDGTVIVETHGNSPDQDTPWRPQPTRLLELVEGYVPSADHVRLSRYGGWMNRPREDATGFFRTRKIDGRWWLIDPEGYRFVHIALNAVREPRGTAAAAGSPEAWAETTTAHLRANGFNGLGNWSSSKLQKVESPLVWVLRRDFMFAFAREKKLVEPAAGTQGFTNRCMPVFHPDFEAFCADYARDLGATANDPALLGIMTDNELQCPVDLLDRCLAVEDGTADLVPNREAARAWLTARHGGVDLAAVSRRDRYEFIAFAFERYYRIVTAAIRRHDQNHLYLGSRINYHSGEFDNPWFWRALAPYHDAVSVNYYGQWGPQAFEFADWAEWADRPILLTEWYAKAMDVPGLANTRGAGWLVRTQEDRGRYYQHFFLAALELPNVVGLHYFKHLDDPAESTALDSAGGANKGLCDIHGKPYQPLLDRARAVNREAYPLIEFFDARRR